MNAHYLIYIKSIIRLAGSMVVKSARTATTLNARLALMGYAVDRDDPLSWKYYLNLAGRYHAADQMMTVTSLDDLTEIEFTIENLTIHQGTKAAYTYGSEYYNTLLSRYPKQQALIKGILNPIDLESAVDGVDHTILFHDASLVEENEQYLIPAIQRFTDLYFANWYNADYDLFEKRNYPAVLGNYYTKLVMEITALRKRACKTDNAHSFHVRQYLSSFSPVGREFDYMTAKQRLWLYRNIRYINRNIGRKEIFEELVQRFMTDRGFSLVGYDFDHDYGKVTDTLVPEVILRRTQINTIPPAMGGRVATVGEILDKELPNAPGNEVLRTDAEVEATAQSQRTLTARFPTKVLESSVLDKTDSEPYTLTDTLLNHWIYLSHAGRYDSVISFINPGNGGEESLSAKDAFVFYLYAYNRWLGVELEHVPVVSAARVQRIRKPDWNELRSMADAKKVPDAYIEHVLHKLPEVGRYVSVAAFKAACRQIQRTMVYFREMRHLNGDYIAEGMLHGLVDRCYMDVRIDLAAGMTYSDWFFEKGIDISAMGNTEYGIVAQAILKTATGADTAEERGFKATHAAMIRIMQALSSYSVQYIAEINDSPLKVLDAKFPKLTIPVLETQQGIDVEHPYPYQRLRAIESFKTKAQVLTHVGSAGNVDETTGHHISVKADVEYQGMTIGTMPVVLSAPVVRSRAAEVVDLSTIVDNDVYGYTPIPGQAIDDYLLSSTAEGYELSDERRTLFLGL